GRHLPRRGVRRRTARPGTVPGAHAATVPDPAAAGRARGRRVLAGPHGSLLGRVQGPQERLRRRLTGRLPSLRAAAQVDAMSERPPPAEPKPAATILLLRDQPQFEVL